MKKKTETVIEPHVIVTPLEEIMGDRFGISFRTARCRMPETG